MITDRDKKIFELMSNFGGKTFLPVLAKTFYRSEQVARNRLNILKKDKLIKYVSTGLMSPRNAIYPTETGLQYFKELGLSTSTSLVSSSTIEHLMLEQIAFFHLKKIGKDVKRTYVLSWSKNHHHTPDLCYEYRGKNVYVEIERTHKRPNELANIMTNIKKDDAHIVIYIFENDKKMNQIGKKIPIFEKAYYVDIDTLIENAKIGKIGAIKQVEFLKKIGENYEK